MTKLQKRIWLDLFVATVCILLAAAGVGLGVHLNAKGAVPILSFIVPGAIVFLVSWLRELSQLRRLDERQRFLIARATQASTSFFVIYLVLASFITFFLAGGRGHVPSYVLPLVVLAGIFLSRFIQAAILLAQLEQEDSDE